MFYPGFHNQKINQTSWLLFVLGAPKTENSSNYNEHYKFSLCPYFLTQC